MCQWHQKKRKMYLGVFKIMRVKFKAYDRHQNETFIVKDIKIIYGTKYVFLDMSKYYDVYQQVLRSSVVSVEKTPEYLKEKQ